MGCLLHTLWKQAIHPKKQQENFPATIKKLRCYSWPIYTSLSFIAINRTKGYQFCLICINVGACGSSSGFVRMVQEKCIVAVYQLSLPDPRLKQAAQKLNCTQHVKKKKKKKLYTTGKRAPTNKNENCYDIQKVVCYSPSMISKVLINL